VEVREPFDVRPLEPSDRDAVMAVATEILCHEYQVKEDLSLDEDLREVATAYAEPHSRFLVAEVSGTVVATAGVRRISDADCELRRLYVLAPYRRQGIATALVAMLLAFVRERGYSRILLEIGPELKEMAGHFSRYGFAPIAESEELPRAGEFMAIHL
jgi:GNAT superfamily N-acetyltransferase